MKKVINYSAFPVEVLINCKHVVNPTEYCSLQ